MALLMIIVFSARLQLRTVSLYRILASPGIGDTLPFSPAPSASRGQW